MCLVIHQATKQKFRAHAEIISHQKASFSILRLIFFCEGFDFMQKAIDNGHKINRVCGKCNTLVQDEIDYGPHNN